MRVAVSGIGGFVGGHLSAALVSRGHFVHGIGQGALAPEVAARVERYDEVDLTQGWPSLDGCDAVIHLAALSAVGPSFDQPQRYLETNCAMVTALGEAQLASSGVRTLVISSGAVLSPHQPMPLAEDAELGLTSPYAVSKVAVENFAAYYRERGLDWTVLRPFNHLGPGQSPGFLLPDLYAAASAVNEQGGPIRVGNLRTRRDYTDVRDVVAAYVSLIETETLSHGVYQVCSGSSTSGEELLSLLLDACGWTDFDVEVDPARLRPQDPAEIRGTAERLQAETGWTPSIPLAQTVQDFVASRASR